MAQDSDIFMVGSQQKGYLTWDRIIRQAYEGPSICTMCYQEGEMLNHLFISYRSSSSLWIRGHVIQTLDKNRHEINKTIE
jgi:hypothetical protein